MQPGKLQRWNRIFREDGNAIVVAMDHAGGGGPIPGLERPGETIARLVAAGVDGIMTSYGTARNFQAELKGRGLIVRIDSGDHLVYSVEDAVRIGADAVITMGWVHEDFQKNRDLAYLAQVATDCERWGMPFMAEMLPYAHIPYFQRAENIVPTIPIGEAMARACRIGAELGADFVKTMYTGDRESFTKVVEGCWTPLLVLGGEFKGETRQMLTNVWEAMRSGARGVVMGRNIWAHPQPGKVAQALDVIIHQGRGVDEAVAALA